MDNNGNFLSKTGVIPNGLKIGDSVTIEGLIKNHYEKMGIKNTSFGGKCKIIINNS